MLVALLLAVSPIALPSQQVETELYRGFMNPPANARPIMRWWWFGPAVTRQELQRELEAMSKAGIGGVEIQPVYPLALDNSFKGFRNFPYLSPEFLGDVSFANATARALGMRVDITLGSGWPYGGPKTTLDLAAGRLKVVTMPVTTSTPAVPSLAEGDKLIAAFVAPGSPQNLEIASVRQIALPGGSLIPAKGPQTEIFFIASHTRQQVKRAAYGAEGYVLDHFSRPAIDEHLADVATPLLNAFGNQPPHSVFSDSLEVYGADWTRDLPAEFRRLRGYDLIPHLPELLAGDSIQAQSVRHDWGETLSDLIRENYLSPLTQFAEAHHTQFRSQTYGEPAVTLADESVPNLPEGEGPQWRAFSFTRWASSASHLYGRNVTSAETWTWLHSPVFRATPLDMKAEADRMFLSGVNQLVGHGYPYSPSKAGEPGWAFYAAAVFNSHNPWFPVMPDVMQYLQRVSWLLRQGKPANDIAILLPEDDAQAAFRPGHVSVTNEMRTRITPELMSTILDAGYNIDYIDAKTIDHLNAIPYPVLILPPTDRIPLATYNRIADYVARGGKLIALGKAPSLAPGLMDQASSPRIAALSAELFQSSGHAGMLIHSTSELTDLLHHALPPDIEATGSVVGLGFIHRKLSDRDVYFVANTSNMPIQGTIQFRSAGHFITALDPDSGKIMQATRSSGQPKTAIRLAPYESRVFVLSAKCESSPAENCTAEASESSPAARTLSDVSRGWDVQFPGSTQKQALSQLDSWTTLPGKNFYSGEAVYTRNIQLSGTPGKGRHIYLNFGTGSPTVDSRPPGASGMHALLDPPIREAAIVLVNGRRVGSLWHPPYRLDITSAVNTGKNLVEVRVYNTAINELAGQPPRDYSALYARYGKRFVPQDMDNLQPIPSGLFGPVTVEEESAR